MDSLNPFLIYFLPFVVMMTLGYFIGSWLERRHYRSIEERERAFAHLPLTTFEEPADDAGIMSSGLAQGSCVISVDYFKTFVAGLRNLLGGRVTSYEPLVDRARREAMLRMRESCAGAHSIVNVRMVTATVGGGANQKRSRGAVSIEVLAYGTALYGNEAPTLAA